MPFGKQIGMYDSADVAKNVKLCMWMHICPILIFAPLISDDCRKSGFVRDVANSLFGYTIKTLAISMCISLIVFLAGLTRLGVITSLCGFISGILGIYTSVIFIRSLISVRKGIRFGHVFVSSYFDN